MTNAMPRVKPNKPFFPLKGKVYVQGAGVVTEIDDPNGAVNRLLQIADGTRNFTQIQTAIAVDFPEVSEDDLIEAIHQLDAHGFIEDGAHSPVGLLDDYSVHRWTRNLSFFEGYSNLSTSKYELQHRLQTTRVTLLGVGGVGSHVLYGLAAMGVEDIRIVDFDAIELTNLNRQILYVESDIGRPKVEAAAERVQAFNPRLRIDPVQLRIGSAEDVFRVVHDRDAVISVVDRPTMRIANWVNEGCVRAGVPFVTGGLETQRAAYYSVVPGRSGCGMCWQRHLMTNDRLNQALLAEKRRIDFSAANAAFVPLVTTVAGCLLAEFARIATKVAPPAAAGRLVEFSFDDFVTREAERWSRDPDCPVCHSGSPDREPPAESAGSELESAGTPNPT